VSKQRQKGTSFERLTADGFAEALNDDRIDRAPLRGNGDRGDISGLRNQFGKIAVEVKNVAKMNLAGWVDEADVERGNLDAVAGVVVHKRVRKGKFLQQYVTMSMRDFLAIGWGWTEGEE
jgi:hypothetical protein